MLCLLAEIPAAGEPPEDGGYPSVLAVLHAIEPHPVEGDYRNDPILPRIKASSHPDRVAGMRLGGLHDGRHGRHTMPRLLRLFPLPEEKAVPLLDLVDAAGIPVMSHGRGAPLELRLFIKAVISVPYSDRWRPSVRLAVKVSELTAGLFPSGWRVGRDWPRLRQALMHARDYAIRDGAGLWFPLALRLIPDRPDPDKLVVIDVSLPGQAAAGPIVDLPEMDRLSVQSAKRWRAYIAAHTLAWAPGRTRVPAPRAGGQRLWATNPDAYPVLTRNDRRRLAFGHEDDRKHRTQREIDDAFRDLPGLVMLTDRAVDRHTGEEGWRLVPENAAKAIQNAQLGESVDLHPGGEQPAQPGNPAAQPGNPAAQPGNPAAQPGSGSPRLRKESP